MLARPCSRPLPAFRRNSQHQLYHSAYPAQFVKSNSYFDVFKQIVHFFIARRFYPKIYTLHQIYNFSIIQKNEILKYTLLINIGAIKRNNNNKCLDDFPASYICILKLQKIVPSHCVHNFYVYNDLTNPTILMYTHEKKNKLFFSINKICIFISFFQTVDLIDLMKWISNLQNY